MTRIWQTKLTVVKNKIIKSHIFNKRETPFGVSLLFYISIIAFSTLVQPSIAQSNIEYDVLNGLSVSTNSLNTDSINVPLIAFSYTFNAILNGTKNNCEYAINKINTFQNTDNYSSIWLNTYICVLNTFQKQYTNAAISGFKLLKSISTYNKQDSIEPEIKLLVSLIEKLKNKTPQVFQTITNITFGDIEDVNLKPTKKSRLSNKLLNSVKLVNSIISQQQNIRIKEPEYLIPKLIYINYLLKNKKPKSGLKALKNIDTSRLSIPWYYYLKGNALMGIGNYNLAKYNFEKYLTIKQTGSFIKASLLRKKWISLITNTPNKYIDSQILTRGNTLMYIDQQALNELKRKYIPILLEIRILYDAGNYAVAKHKLSKINIKDINENHKSEYYYLKARITKTHNVSQALTLFIKTINCKNTGAYYNKQAALEAAKILIKRGDINHAKLYLNKAKQIKSNEYYGTINNETQFLLDSLPQ